MIFRKSIKQLFRTPLTTTLFIVLMTAAAFFLCAGVVIWARNHATIAAYEDTFMTIATVEQKADSMETTSTWDAYTQQYTRTLSGHFDTIYNESVLDFDGAEYINQPLKRPFYMAYVPDMQLWPAHVDGVTFTWNMGWTVVEFTPLEDYLPDHPSEIRIERILSEVREETDSPIKVGDVLPFCDHYNDSPIMLEAGKTYITRIKRSTSHDDTFESAPEYVPNIKNRDMRLSTQYNADGTPAYDENMTLAVCEVTEGFYETKLGKAWLNYVDTMYTIFDTMPVLPTDGTEMLLPFYNRSAFIIDGEDISAEEYDSGEYVCLITENFAKENNFSVGDTINLPLFAANYRSSPAEMYYEIDFATYRAPDFSIEWDDDIGSILNAEGEMYPVFSEHEYTVKGIYHGVSGNQDARVSLGANTVIVPSKSVRESDVNNIIDYGPMTNANTSFQLPNGSIELFTENWLQQPHAENFQLTFYDRGYTQVQRGIANMKRMSTLFLTVGGVLALVLVLYFSNMFITKNKSRTAVERMLGFTKKQCAVSLLSGFMFCALIAAVIGCGAGMVLEDKLTHSLLNKEYYDTTFTIGAVDMDVEVEAGDSNFVALACPAAGVLLLAATFGIGCLFMHGNLKEEPLVMLGKKVE